MYISDCDGHEPRLALLSSVPLGHWRPARALQADLAQPDKQIRKTCRWHMNQYDAMQIQCRSGRRTQWVDHVHHIIIQHHHLHTQSHWKKWSVSLARQSSFEASVWDACRCLRSLTSAGTTQSQSQTYPLGGKLWAEASCISKSSISLHSLYSNIFHVIA